MAVFRIEKTKDYTVMSNCHLRDRRLNLKAKGLLSVMLSLPDEWDYSVTGLCTITGEGRDSIRVTLKVLEDAGYLVRHQLRGEDGRMTSQAEYVIYEAPQNMDPPRTDFPTSVNPTSVNPTSEKPTSANPTQLNTNNNKILNISNKDSGCGPQQPLTRDLLVQIWNSIPSVITIKGITEGSDREKKVDSFLLRYSAQDMEAAAGKIAGSAYLQGMKPKFDWFLRNMDKILEGNYDGEYRKESRIGSGLNNFQQRSYDYSEVEELLVNRSVNNI